MSIQFNHTIISAIDAQASANFLTEILGLETPTSFGPFIVVKTDNGVSLDFRTTEKEIQPRHFAFLVDESKFDDIFSRITQKNLTYWADPERQKTGKINHHDKGRGFYFLDLNGHLLEVITKPYGG